MFALIKFSGVQHIVKQNDVFKVSTVPENVGEEFVINDVLSIIDGDKVKIGSPLVAGSSVTVRVLEKGKDKKIIIFKKKRRQNYKRKNGHRQPIAKLQVVSIN